MARTVQSRVGNMCDAKLKQMASMNGLKNAPICNEHVTNVTGIFGPNTAALEGKTVKRPSPQVLEDGRVNIPHEFHHSHHFMTLVADVFFMNGVVF